MGTLSYTVPVAGTDLNSLADPELATALSTILTWANGNVDAINLSAVLAQSATVNQAGQTVKGATNISTSQSTSSTTYTTLATPDQVTGIVLPSNGLICVWYQATWQSSVNAAGSAAIFVGSNQLQAENTGASPAAQSAVTSGTANNSPLFSAAPGLSGANVTGYTGDVTTGQAVGAANSGGPCYIFVSAGTYTISVQFKASSGSVTASNRKLWVEAKSFS